MVRTFISSVLVIAGTSTVASAGDLAAPAETMAPAPVMAAPAPTFTASDWTGLYVGGSLGMGDVSIGGGADIDASNVGLQAGYLYDLGGVVLGGELDFDKLDIDGVGDAEVLRLKGKVGYDAGAFMPYVTAGAAQLTLKDAGDAKDRGYFLGLGADYAVTDSIRVGGEILQHTFEDFNGSGADIEATTMALKVSYSF